MIEIIPNWHPLLVHFTIGLLSTSVLFYLGSAILPHTNSWKQQWLNMANWSLWSGCLFAMGTAFAGWLAYNSVAHDSASHAAMTLHRNWALPTGATFLVLGLWAIFIARKDRRPGFLFLSFSIIAASALMVTGWLGAEAVYRYGLGVKSLPVVAEGADGHNHSHGSEHDESAMNEDSHHEKMPSATESSKPSVEESADGHNHSHGLENNKADEYENQDTAKEIGQSLKEDAHQHNYNKNKELSHFEQGRGKTEHPRPLDKENTSKQIPLSPSDTSSLNPIEKQNEESVHEETHAHDHDHGH